MMRRLSGKLTYANVMVTILAFVMLSGGAAYAASQLEKNSVGAKQLKKNAVTTAKVKNGGEHLNQSLSRDSGGARQRCARPRWPGRSERCIHRSTGFDPANRRRDADRSGGAFPSPWLLHLHRQAHRGQRHRRRLEPDRVRLEAPRNGNQPRLHQDPPGHGPAFRALSSQTSASLAR